RVRPLAVRDRHVGGHGSAARARSPRRRRNVAPGEHRWRAVHRLARAGRRPAHPVRARPRGHHRRGHAALRRGGPVPRGVHGCAMSRLPDVIVVGAGVVGAAVARALARDGVRVQVLEATFPGSGATAAGMGHIVVMDDSDAQFALTSYSRALLAAESAELPPSCELDVCGTLWLAEDESQRTAVQDKAAYYETRGVRVEILDGAALAEAEPNLRPGLAGALRVPDDAVVYPPALAAWLLEQAVAAGAEVRTGEKVDAIVARAVQVNGQT